MSVNTNSKSREVKFKINLAFNYKAITYQPFNLPVKGILNSYL